MALDFNARTGEITATTFTGAVSGNAATATTAATWTTTRTIDMSGDISSDAVNIDGSGNITITTTTIAAKAVDVAMLADGTDGELITWSATGVAATVPVGTATHVLTSNGIGVAPTFQAAAGGGGTVTSSGTPLINEVAVFTTGTDIDSDSTFTWDSTTLTATNLAGAGAGITALTAANVSGGNLGSGVLPYVTATTANSNFAIAMVNTTGIASGNFGLLLEGAANNFTFNPTNNSLDINGTQYETGGIFPPAGNSFLIQQSASDVFIDCNNNSSIDMYFNGIMTFRAGGLGAGTANIIGELSTDADPRVLYFDRQDLATRSLITSSTDFTIAHQVHAGHVIITAEDTGGVERTILNGDPDAVTILRGDTNVEIEVSAGTNAILATGGGSVDLYYNGAKTFGQEAPGEAVIFGDLDTNIDFRVLYGAFADGTHKWSIGQENGTDLAVHNDINAGIVHLSAKDTGGITRFFLQGDPDAITDIRGDTDVQILVNVGTEIAVEAVANGKVGLRYNAIEMAATKDRAGSGAASGLEVRHADDIMYDVGFNVVPPTTVGVSANFTLGQSGIGKSLIYNTGTARSCVINSTTTIPIGAMYNLKVGPSAGTCTVDGGASVVLRWWNGTSWTDTAAAGNITAGEGEYTIWKESLNLWWVTGPALS